MKAVIIGAGYVGLATAAGLARRGHHAVCHDIDARRLQVLQQGKAPFFEPGLDDLLSAAIASGMLTVEPSLPQALQDADVSIICVGTPSTAEGIDLTHIIAAAGAIGKALPRDRFHTVAVKSTVIPGTTEGAVKRALERTSGLKAGKGFGLGMVPEFLREGAAVADTLNPDRIVIGATDPRSTEILAELFAVPGCPVIRTAPRNAEMAKYAANALMAAMISFANEIAALCEATPGLSEETVMQTLHLDRRLTWRKGGAARKAGICSYLKAGIGFGGSCFPKDLRALRHFAAAQGVATPMLDAVLDINETRAEAVIDLLEKTAGPLKGKRVAVAGLAFKELTDDVRESPALRLIAELCRRGAQVAAHDPVVDGKALRFPGKVEIAPTLAAAVTNAEACIIATRWPDYAAADWPELAKLMRRPVILDGRQMVKPEHRARLAHYIAIGEG